MIRLWPWLFFFVVTSFISFLLLPTNLKFPAWLNRRSQQRRSPIWIYRYQIPKGIVNRRLLDKQGQLRSCSLKGEADVEVAFSAILERSAYVTEVAEQADYFFIPAYPACHYQQCLAKHPGNEAGCRQSTIEYLERVLDWLEPQPSKPQNKLIS